MQNFHQEASLKYGERKRKREFEAWNPLEVVFLLALLKLKIQNELESEYGKLNKRASLISTSLEGLPETEVEAICFH